jgi:hypothetical protein
MSSQQNIQELLFPHQMCRMLVFAATSKLPAVRFRTSVVAQCVRYTSTAAQQFLLFQIFLVAFSLSHSLLCCWCWWYGRRFPRNDVRVIEREVAITTNNVSLNVPKCPLKAYETQCMRAPGCCGMRRNASCEMLAHARRSKDIQHIDY